MAAFDTTRSFTAPSMAGRITSVFASLFSALSDWNDARITRKSLSRLSARELDDIGLSYGDIDAIATRDARN